MMTHNRKHKNGGVKRSCKIFGAALLLSIAGPPALAPGAPQAAEAQVYPERQVVRFLGLHVCAWYNCYGSYCCGPRADPII